jgi:type I restriction-modification system DNA methylase subunit
MTSDLAERSAESAATDEHGEVFTRLLVVELILDLAGYAADRDLGSMRAVEPLCGAGAFLGPMVTSS